MDSRGMPRILILCAAVLLIVVIADSPELAAGKKSIEIDFEKYVLGNGLEVVLHEDHSDPIVSVATLMHVGSSREKPGRTGFAHFFEHMSFNDSENVPRGANRKMIPELGGLRNGGTSTDFTVYYEVVPTDAFEKILWIASDRLGYMINTVTVGALEREKQVVKNEKRQRCDNAPYGFTDEVQRAALYPEGHPYSWTVIGSLPDLQAASLDDVREFYFDYYGANNATLVIAGDIDVEKTKELVERWFGEIRRCDSETDPARQPVALQQTKSLYHLDNFAKLPELQILWPAVEQFHEDSYALTVLADILTGSKKAPFYRTIVEEKKLAPDVTAYLNSNEIAGEFCLSVRANAGVDLDEVKAAIDESFAVFEKDGVPEKELKRIKAQNEINLYSGLSTVLNKTFQLALYNEFKGDPGYITEVARRSDDVSAEDVMRVYEKYIRGRPAVMTSFVPKDHPDLALAGAEEAEIWQEEISETAEHEQVSQGEEAQYDKTPSKYDRSEPGLGDTPMLSSPKIWTETLSNGMMVYGINNSEVPLVNFSLILKGGHCLDPAGKEGTARLLASMLKEGTKDLTPSDLEETLGLLGSTIEIAGRDEDIVIMGTSLARNFDKTMEILTEMILEPRWDEAEFERLKQETRTRLKDRESSPRAIARNVMYRLLYGDGHMMGTGSTGTPESVERITLEDLKAFYSSRLSPSVSGFLVAGDVERKKVLKAMKRLGSKWKRKEVEFPEYSLPSGPAGKVFFVDIPGARQSQIVVCRLALSAKDDDFNELVYANQILGGGSSGRLFQLLRIEKGFTYGAYSFLSDKVEVCPYSIQTSVRTNATGESLQLIQSLVRDYREDFGQTEMEITKNKVIKGNTRAFESLNSLLEMLYEIFRYDRPLDYVEIDQQELVDMQLGDFHRLIEEYIDESEMMYIVVGDAATQLESVEALGYGAPVMLDAYGNIME